MKCIFNAQKMHEDVVGKFLALFFWCLCCDQVCGPFCSVCVCLASKFKNMLRIYELNKKSYLRKVCVTWFHYHLVFFLGSTLPKNGNKIHKPCITHVPTTGWHHVLPLISTCAYSLFLWILLFNLSIWRLTTRSLFFEVVYRTPRRTAGSGSFWRECFVTFCAFFDIFILSPA